MSISDNHFIKGDNSTSSGIKCQSFTILTFVESEKNHPKVSTHKREVTLSDSCTPGNGVEGSDTFTILTYVGKENSDQNNKMPGVLTQSVDHTTNAQGDPSVVCNEVTGYLPSCASEDKNCPPCQHDRFVSGNDCIAKTETTNHCLTLKERSEVKVDEVSNSETSAGFVPEKIEPEVDAVIDSSDNIRQQSSLNGQKKSSQSIDQNGGLNVKQNGMILDKISSEETDRNETTGFVEQTTTIQDKSLDHYGCQPSDGGDDGTEEKVPVEMRPKSYINGQGMSRRTQQIVSDAFHFLKEIDISNIDLEDIGEDNEVEIGSRQFDVHESDKQSPEKSNSEGILPTSRKLSGEYKPTPAPKPKRLSSKTETECANSNTPDALKCNQDLDSGTSQSVIMKPENQNMPSESDLSNSIDQTVVNSPSYPQEYIKNSIPTQENQRQSQSSDKISENLRPSGNRPSLSRSEAVEERDNIEIGDRAEKGATLRKTKSRTKSSANDEDSGDDSSDEDTGIYNESYRNSCWIQMSEDGNNFTPASSAPGTFEFRGLQSQSETFDVEHDEPVRTQENKDDVFTEGQPSHSPRYHKRSDSTTTTRSESEFKREYQFRRKCFVQRSDSQQEYHRLSAKFYDHEKNIVIHRPSLTSDLGLHILDSHPAIITSVDPGSPAEKAGVKKGQILISVNQVNVLQASHAEIVSLVQAGAHQVALEVASSDIGLVRDLQSPIVTGYMHKLSSSSFVRNWKKRYFVLRKDNCLYYYKTNQDCSDPLGAIPLLNYTASKHTDSSKPHSFKAEKYGAKTFYFYVDTREDMARWVCAMNEAALASKKRKDSWMDITSHNVGLPALEIRRAECTGYLRKSNKAMRNWQKRYCVLKDACVYYYKNMNSHNAQGMAHLHGYQVDTSGIPNKPFSFLLQPPESQMRTFYFVAENETDKLRWVEALRKSVQRWIKVD